MSVVFVKTGFKKAGKKQADFIDLRQYLERQGFCLLSRYEENSRGEAIFINGKIYDAIFK